MARRMVFLTPRLDRSSVFMMPFWALRDLCACARAIASPMLGRSPLPPVSKLLEVSDVIVRRQFSQTAAEQFSNTVALSVLTHVSDTFDHSAEVVSYDSRIVALDEGVSACGAAARDEHHVNTRYNDHLLTNRAMQTLHNSNLESTRDNVCLAPCEVSGVLGDNCAFGNVSSRLTEAVRPLCGRSSPGCSLRMPLGRLV